MEDGLPIDGPDLSGAWILRTFYLEDAQTGERVEPLGPKPKGALIMHPGGRMAAVITPAKQAPAKTEAEQAAAFQRLIAYSGHYRLEPPDQFVTTIDVAWLQPWVGTQQARTYKFSGDTLEIVSAPTRVPLTGEALVIGVLSWVRESAMSQPA
jgi:hypothetical protein